MDSFRVKLTRAAEKDLERLPRHVVLKLASWVEDVGRLGISEVRKVPGYHDEPLKGVRKGQRSIRLSKHYRAIYCLKDGIFIYITEVNRHEY